MPPLTACARWSRSRPSCARTSPSPRTSRTSPTRARATRAARSSRVTESRWPPRSTRPPAAASTSASWITASSAARTTTATPTRSSSGAPAATSIWSSRTRVRVSYEELHETLRRALLKVGFEQGRAELCARLFADTDRDGVYTHGLNRFPRFLEMIQKGLVDVRASAVCVEARGAFECWDGGGGAGNLNAHDSM